MRNSLVQRYAAYVVMFCLINISAIHPAVAGAISTETAIELENRQEQIGRINDVLAQENVQQMLVRMGVDPEQASKRVNSLTNEELQLLHQKMEQMPAAGTGVVEVVGIVAIVLIILELLNVTDFFTEF